MNHGETFAIALVKEQTVAALTDVPVALNNWLRSSHILAAEGVFPMVAT